MCGLDGAPHLVGGMRRYYLMLEGRLQLTNTSMRMRIGHAQEFQTSKSFDPKVAKVWSREAKEIEEDDTTWSLLITRRLKDDAYHRSPGWRSNLGSREGVAGDS